MKRLLLAAAAWAVLAVSQGAIAQGAAPAASTPAPAFILYVSPASRAFLTVDPDLKWRANRWRDLLVERGASFAVVTHPQQLAKMPAGSALIVPSAVILGEEERRVIAARVAAGDGLLATWMPGTLSAAGAPVLPTFLEEAFGVKTRLARLEDKGFLIASGDTPLTHGVAAGSRLWVTQDARLTLPVLATPGAGYLSDWSRSLHDTGMITFTTVGASRRALLGWSEPAWEAHPAEYRRIASNALDWVEGRPIAFARSWPHPYDGAMTIGVDALWRFENLPRLAEALGRNGVRASFHFMSADAAANATVIRDLARAGHSIGSFGDSAEPFAGRPEAEQRARVERVVGQFRNALGGDVTVAGLRAPQGATDAATESVASALGYLVDIGRIDSLVPVLAKDRRLVIFTNSANIDAQADAKSVTAALSESARRARLLGGHAFVGLDGAGYMPDSSMVKGLDAFFAGAKQSEKSLWMAPAADVAAWWRQREQVKVSSRWSAAEGLLSLDIAVSAAMPFPTAIALVPPPGRANVKLDETPAGVSLKTSADGTPAIVLTGLSQGTHSLRLRFQP